MRHSHRGEPCRQSGQRGGGRTFHIGTEVYSMPKLQQCVRIVQLTLYTRLSKIKSVDCAQFIMESVFGSRPKAADHRSPENKNYRREDRMQSSVLSLACELL